MLAICTSTSFRRLKYLFSKINLAASCPPVCVHRPLASLRMADKADTPPNPSELLAPPASVHGMKVLERGAFKKEISVPSLTIPAAKIHGAVKTLKPCFLKMPKFQPVQEAETGRKIFLHPGCLDGDHPLFKKLLEYLNDKKISWTNVDVTYDNWSSDQIFKAVLPAESPGNVTGFSIIGHIIHLNLKPELLEYKSLIGQVLLDKNPSIKTVVNKTQTIESEFRNFSMELLAGEPRYEVIAKENNCQYVFDFSKVFWNPRLVHEHAEIAKEIDPYDSVFDVFAGVGPFAVPLAKKKCEVHANDLNPDSYHWLYHNAKLNKVSDRLHSYNMDGEEFIRVVVKKGLLDFWHRNEDNRRFHVIMNLPACALDFLEAFDGLLDGEDAAEAGDMPIVYCYFFKKKDDILDELMGKYFDEETRKGLKITEVRLVAPNKLMMRVTFKMSSSLLFNCRDSLPRPTKKLKSDY